MINMINGGKLTPRWKELLYVRCIKESLVNVNNKNLRYVTFLCEDEDDDRCYISVNDNDKEFEVKTAYQIEGYFYNKRRLVDGIYYDNWKGTDVKLLAKLSEEEIKELYEEGQIGPS